MTEIKKVDTTETSQATLIPPTESPALPKPTAEETAQQKTAEENDAKKVDEIRKSLDPNKEAKDKYQPFLDANQDKLTEHLGDLLKKYRDRKKGEDLTELKAQFEATIEYCIENGKSYAENVFFMLTAAVVDGLVDAQHINHYSTYLKSFPHLQYLFQDMDAAQNYEKICRIVKKYFAEDYKAGKVGMDFRNFYWTIVQTDETVHREVEKSVQKSDVLDHDYAGEIMGAGNAQTMKQYLGTKMAGQHNTSVENVYAGNVMWLEQNRNLVFKNPKKAAIGLARFVMMDGMLSGTAYVKSQHLRLNETLLQAIPRISSITNHPESNLGELRERAWDAVKQLDPVLFRALKEYDEKKWPIVQKRLKAYGFKDIGSIDQLYDHLDEVMLKIAKPGVLASLFGKYRQFANQLAA